MHAHVSVAVLSLAEKSLALLSNLLFANLESSLLRQYCELVVVDVGSVVNVSDRHEHIGVLVAAFNEHN